MMNLYSIFMSLITAITILSTLTFEDIYVSVVIFVLLSIIAVPISGQYKLKEDNYE